jgi:DNA-binding MarR family transcriptional regulator
MATKTARPERPPAPKTKRTGRRSQALDFVIYKVGILRRLIERYANPPITEGHGLTVAEWRVLTHLFTTSPMTATELSARLWTDKAEVSRASSALIAKSLITSRPDAEDRRSTLLAITKSGEQLHDRILPLRRLLQDELTAVLTARESRMLHMTLDKLIEYLSAQLAAGETAASAKPRATAARKRPAAARTPK